jgi:4-amino-4-deoxy-L-arabinose transferase-like glycosyltransferase
VLAAVAFSPAAVNQADSWAYVLGAKGDALWDPTRPGGYALFLRAVHAVNHNIAFTVAVQHMIGLATALLLYGATNRLTSSRWAGLLPAAVVLLNGDQVLVEHAILSEGVFAFLVAVAVYALARSMDASGRLLHVILLGAGAFLGLSAVTRVVGEFLIPVAAIWALLIWHRPWRRGVAAAALIVAGSVLVLAPYLVAAHDKWGVWSLTNSSGWSSYARVAPFADCNEFTPPRGTEGLCEATPASERQFPDFYGWSSASPARKLFGGPPAANPELRAFGREAVLHQPAYYAKAVLRDLWRYVHPGSDVASPKSLIGPWELRFALRPPDEQCPYPECRPPSPAILVSSNRRNLSTWYSPFQQHVRGGFGVLQDWQGAIRMHGGLLLAFVLVAIAGFATGTGRQRITIFLVLGIALALLVLPVLSTTYNARYAVPAAGFLAAAAAAGAVPLFLRARVLLGVPRNAQGSAQSGDQRATEYGC